MADPAELALQELLELLDGHAGVSIDFPQLIVKVELSRLLQFGVYINHSCEMILKHITGGMWHSLLDALLSGEKQFADLRKWFIDKFHAQQRAHVEALTPLLFKQHARRRLDEAARTISTTFKVGVDLAPRRGELQLSWSPKIENSMAKLCEESEKWLAFLTHVAAP
jgi:hypothetical protein